MCSCMYWYIYEQIYCIRRKKPQLTNACAICRHHKSDVTARRVTDVTRRFAVVKHPALTTLTGVKAPAQSLLTQVTFVGARNL